MSFLPIFFIQFHMLNALTYLALFLQYPHLHCLPYLLSYIFLILFPFFSVILLLTFPLLLSQIHVVIIHFFPLSLTSKISVCSILHYHILLLRDSLDKDYLNHKCSLLLKPKCLVYLILCNCVLLILIMKFSLLGSHCSLIYLKNQLSIKYSLLHHYLAKGQIF